MPRGTQRRPPRRNRPAETEEPPRRIQGPEGPLTLRVIRSTRRAKTVSARLIDARTLEMRVPAPMTRREIDEMVESVLARLRQRRTRAAPSDADLERRAQRLNRELFGGRLRWRSIRFVGNQRRSFGSCTPAAGTIRISDRLASAPGFVLDYVVVHELAHLAQPGHTPAFWELVYRYRWTERARGYLMALQMDDGEAPTGSPIATEE